MADDERPQYLSGVGTINGTQFHWGSGTPGKYWSIPYGDYPVTPNAPTGAWAKSVGAIPINNNIIPDPVLHRNRVGIMIHPSASSGADLDALYTQGCFAVAPQEWPAVKQQILAEASKGPLYLHVQPGQAAAFTHTPTLSQAGAPPASDSPPGTTIASPAGPTPAPAAPASPWRNPAGVALPPGMGNNNPANIKYYAGSPFAGVVGPSKNTDQGDPQFVFESPQAGMNAAYQLLGRKYGAGMTTPAMIIAGEKGWTPGNMQAAASIAKSAGIGVNDDIGFNDPIKAQKFLTALVKQEQGAASSYYPTDLYTTALKSAAPTAVASNAPAYTGSGAMAFPTQPAASGAIAAGASPAAAPTSVAAAPAAPVQPPSPADAFKTAAAAGDVGGMMRALGQQDPKTGKSTMDQLKDDMSLLSGKKPGQQQQDQQPPQIPTAPARNVSLLAGGAPSLAAQTLQSYLRPLSWSTGPMTGVGAQNQPLANVGPQQPYGLSLNTGAYAPDPFTGNFGMM